MHRLRRTELRGRARLGYTLVELVVAMLISCIMVTAMFGAALTSKSSAGKNDRRLLANQAARQLTSQLKGYVNGCGCVPSTGDCSACINVAPATYGPNSTVNGMTAASWSLNGGAITDSLTKGGVGATRYALACNAPHFIYGLVPQIEAAPYYGWTQYTVTYAGACPAGIVSGTIAPQVQVAVNWTEP